MSLWALKFTMPEDVRNEDLEVAPEEETDYGDTKNPLDGSSEEIPEPIITDAGSEAEEAPDVEADEADFIEIPLLATEAEIEPDLETAVVEEALAEGEGRIVGQIFDKETGAPIRGVAIAVEGTDLGTITDESGNFKLNKVPEGTYTLAYFKTGYLEANITDIGVESGEVKTLDFALPPRPAETSGDVYDLGTITVTADQANDAMALVDLKQTSVGAVDFLSSEDMARFGGDDVAGLVNRISGVNVVEGKFAVVRGLGDRYSSTLVNSLPVPSPDPVRQGVQLDLFATSIIDSVVAEKTFVPSLPSNSSGAAFNLNTRSYPEEFSFWVESGFSINDNTRDNLLRNRNIDPFTGTPGASEFDLKSVLGIRDVVPSGTEFAAIEDQVGNGLLDFGGRSYEAGFGNTYEMPWGGNLGFVTSLSYNSSSFTSEGKQQDRYALISATSSRPSRSRQGSAFAGELPAGGLLYDFTQSKVSEDSASLIGIGIDLDSEGKQQIDLTYLRSRSNISEASRRENGFLPDDFRGRSILDRGFGQNTTGSNVFNLVGEIIGRGNSDSLTQGQDILSFEQRTLEVKQVSGEHTFEALSRDLFTFNWGASSNKAKSEIGNPDPDNFVGGQTSLFYLQNVSDAPFEGSLGGTTLPEPVPSGGYLFGGDTALVDGFTEDVVRSTARTIDDDHDSWRADLDVTPSDFFSIKIGFFKEELERQVKQRDSVFSLNGSSISSGENLAEFVSSTLSTSGLINIILDSFAEVTREVDDKYIQFNTNITNNLEFVFGLRSSDVEMSAEGTGELLPGFPLTGSLLAFTEAPVAGNVSLTNGDLLGFGSSNATDQIVSGRIDEQYVLPALSIKHIITDAWTLRLDYSETFALPSQRELSPVFTVDTFTGDRVVGNPTLQPSDVQNMGARIEYIAKDNVSRLGFSVFYKNIEDPIEQIGLNHSPTGIDVQSFINNENTATVLGYEIEARISLDLLNQLWDKANVIFLEYFSLGGNASFIDAEVGYPDSVVLSYINSNTGESIYGDGKGNIDIPSKRRLFDQPEWTLNFDITFEQPDWGTSLTASLYAQSDVLTSVGTGSSLGVDQFTMPYEQLDLNFTQTFGKNWRLELRVNNLLDGKRGIIYDLDVIDDEIERFEYKIGRTYSMSLEYNF